MKIDSILSRLEGVNLEKGHACCPAHADKTPSLVFSEGRDGRVLLHCHAGCSLEAVCGAIGLTPRDLFPPNEKSRPQTMAATYEYTDEKGVARLQVCRTADKRFFQRRPNGKGGWENGLGNVKPVLYRLPALLQAIQRNGTVFITEGEKDADNLAGLGLTATTNPMGAGKWRDYYSDFLVGADVVILPDNDNAGRGHAMQVAQSLHGKAASIKVLELPNLPAKGDVSDWLTAGGTKEGLLQLALICPLFAPAPEKPKAPHVAAKAEALSDVGNADRLAARHGENLRFCKVWQKWFVWDGAHWAVDNVGAIVERAKETAFSVWGEVHAGVSADQKEQIAKHAIYSNRERSLSAMIKLAQSIPEIVIQPKDFDTNNWLLNVANGTVDLRTGKLRAHRRTDHITKKISTEYLPSAKCPRWLSFLDEIMLGNKSLVDFLQRALGMSLTGDVSEHALFVLHGGGRNGKSTLLGTIMELLEGYGASAPPELLVSRHGDRHPTELADLFGKRMVVSMETDEGKHLAESLVKQLTGGDKIKARRMHEDFWEFAPTHKLWMATNSKPKVRGTGVAIWSRLKLIPFDAQFLDGDPRQDKKLPETLRDELPGILKWAVDGCLAWQEMGLGVPKEVHAATAGYREQENPLTDFLAERCVFGKDARVDNAIIWTAYLTWCRDFGEKYPLGRKQFTQEISTRGVEQCRGSTRYWQGIGLTVRGQELQNVGWEQISSGHFQNGNNPFEERKSS